MKTFQSADGHTIRSGMQVWVVDGGQLSFQRVGPIHKVHEGRDYFLYPIPTLLHRGAAQHVTYLSYENAKFKLINDASAGSGGLELDRNYE